MFEISQLKEKKLVELQEIAEKLNVPKFKSLKKIDLVYQILDLQAANPTIVAPKATPVAAAKPPRPRRERISKPKEANPKPLAQNADSPASTEAKPASKVDSKKKRVRRTAQQQLVLKSKPKRSRRLTQNRNQRLRINKSLKNRKIITQIKTQIRSRIRIKIQIINIQIKNKVITVTKTHETAIKNLILNLMPSLKVKVSWT